MTRVDPDVEGGLLRKTTGRSGVTCWILLRGWDACTHRRLKHSAELIRRYRGGPKVERQSAPRVQGPHWHDTADWPLAGGVQARTTSGEERAMRREIR